MHESMKYETIRGVEGSVSMNDLTITEPANADAIRSRILTIRGVQVMLDRDLAELYGGAVQGLAHTLTRTSPTRCCRSSRRSMENIQLWKCANVQV